MIATSTEVVPRHWGLSAAEREDRGRHFSVLATIVIGLFHVGHVVPTGKIWPVIVFASFAAVIVLPLWLVGFVHTVGMRRVIPGSASNRALLWWLFPWVAAGGAFAAIDSGLPRRAGLTLAAADLAQLEADARSAPLTFEVLPDRSVGPFPCRDLRRYPTRALRLEFVGTGMFEGARGLVWLPEGVVMPAGMQPTGEPVLGRWFPWLEERP